MNELVTNRESELNARILNCTVDHLIEELLSILEEFYAEKIVFNFPALFIEGKQALKEILSESAVLLHLAFEVGDYRLDDFRQIDSMVSNNRNISNWSLSYRANDTEDLQKVSWQTIRHWENGLIVSEVCSVN